MPRCAGAWIDAKHAAFLCTFFNEKWSAIGIVLFYPRKPGRRRKGGLLRRERALHYKREFEGATRQQNQLLWMRQRGSLVMRMSNFFVCASCR